MCPHRRDSNECSQYTILNIKKEITLNYSKSAAMGFFSKGLKNEFEPVVVSELLVFQSLKVYCSYFFYSFGGGFSLSLSLQYCVRKTHIVCNLQGPVVPN